MQELGLILEFIDGSTLREGQFSFGIDYLKVIWQIASGLTDIHGAGVIHRDIKPDNMRIDSAGVAKILDFGLAREKNIDNKTRSIVGMPGYMAPELSGTSTIHFSSAVDMYSFGVTALSLLAPFKTMIGTGMLSSVDKLLPPSEQSLRDLIKTCLSDDPKARPTADFARDVVAGRLVFDRHRARLIDGATVVLIDKAARGRTVKTTVGQLDIWYDGEKFLCLNVQGQVNINNQIISSGSVILNSCVIIFGGYQSPQRAFVPVDLSRPEVML